jgi:hypothetical protein
MSVFFDDEQAPPSSSSVPTACAPRFFVRLFARPILARGKLHHAKVKEMFICCSAHPCLGGAVVGLCVPNGGPAPEIKIWRECGLQKGGREGSGEEDFLLLSFFVKMDARRLSEKRTAFH